MNNLEIFIDEILNAGWLFVIAGGLSMVAVFVVLTHLAWTGLENQVKVVMRSFEKRTKKRSSLNPKLEMILGLKKQESKLEQIMQKIAVELPGIAMLTAKTTICAVVFSAFGLFLGVIWLKNISAAIVLVVFAVLATIQTFGKKNVRLQKDYLRELSASIRTFAALFESSGSLNTALKETAARSPKPIDSVFETVYTKLNNGVTIEEAVKVIPQRIKLGHAKLFALHLTEADREGTALLPQFARLASQVDSVHDSQLENAVLLAPGRFTNIALHIGIVVLVLLLSFFVPGAKHYLTDEPIGRAIVLFTFMSPILSMIVEIMWSRVEEE